MTDRLEEIKRVHNSGNYAHRVDCRVCWLIARVEELQLTIDGIMHSVDKWLEGDQLKNDPVTRASDAREIALREIERRESELAKYKIQHDNKDLEFLAKQAKTGSLAAKQAYINGLEFELAEERRKKIGPFGPGTTTNRIGPVMVCGMDPEYRDLLDRAIDEWKEHWKKLPVEHRISDPDDVYGFAYWLIRWSGLVQPAKPLYPVISHKLTDAEIEQLVSRPGKLVYVKKEEPLRDFAEVMNRIIDVIPENHPAKLPLSNIVQASYFKAPELMRDCWQSAATVLESLIEPIDRGSEWALKVRDIFAGKEEPCPTKPE